jgi:hypothetical protein
LADSGTVSGNGEESVLGRGVLVGDIQVPVTAAEADREKPNVPGGMVYTRALDWDWAKAERERLSPLLAK